MDPDNDLLIRTIIGEAGGESPEGQAAVAHVILNRLAGGAYGTSLRDVILAPKQFSMWNEGDPAGVMASRIGKHEPKYQQTAQLVNDVRTGKIADPTGGATHYYNPARANPAWGGDMQGVRTIGSHRFGVVDGANAYRPVSNDETGATIDEYFEGNARREGFTNPRFERQLLRFMNENPYGVSIKSLDRTVARQQQLWDEAVKKHGSEAEARRWVAPPGGSNHNRGLAADLSYEDDNARAWAHANAAKYGLSFPLANENWHVEPIDARNGKTMMASNMAPAAQAKASDLLTPEPWGQPGVFERSPVGAALAQAVSGAGVKTTQARASGPSAALTAETPQTKPTPQMGGRSQTPGASFEAVDDPFVVPVAGIAPPQPSPAAGMRALLPSSPFQRPAATGRMI